jgi:hypothetical protein
MPYIPEEERKEIEYSLNTLKAYLGISEDLPLGKLNYIVSTLISHLIEIHGTSYTIGNNLIGVLECAKHELYRRILSPYEDSKIELNGDVY